MCFDERYDIGEDLRGRTSKPLFGGLVYRASPSSLVEAMCFDSAGGEGAEEGVVSVYMVAVAVDEDELCYRRGVGL